MDLNNTDTANLKAIRYNVLTSVEQLVKDAFCAVKYKEKGAELVEMTHTDLLAFCTTIVWFLRKNTDESLCVNPHIVAAARIVFFMLGEKKLNTPYSGPVRIRRDVWWILMTAPLVFLLHGVGAPIITLADIDKDFDKKVLTDILALIPPEWIEELNNMTQKGGRIGQCTYVIPRDASGKQTVQ